MPASRLPSGVEFFDLLAELEDACSKFTRERIPHLGKKVPSCHKHLGNTLSLLYQEACCQHGCPNDDHFGQRLAGRAVSHALASYRLLTTGYYDESLALTRNLGELANLLWLFRLVPEEKSRWNALESAERRRRYSPAEVRIAIEAAKSPIPIDRERYGGLCETAVHVNPGTAPQSHGPDARPTLGAWFQDASFMASLNELAGAVGTCAAGLAPFLSGGAPRERLLKASVELLREVGGLDLAAVRRLRRPRD